MKKKIGFIGLGLIGGCQKGGARRLRGSRRI